MESAVSVTWVALPAFPVPVRPAGPTADPTAFTSAPQANAVVQTVARRSRLSGFRLSPRREPP